MHIHSTLRSKKYGWDDDGDEISEIPEIKIHSLLPWQNI